MVSAASVMGPCDAFGGYPVRSFRPVECCRVSGPLLSHSLRCIRDSGKDKSNGSDRFTAQWEFSDQQWPSLLNEPSDSKARWADSAEDAVWDLDRVSGASRGGVECGRSWASVVSGVEKVVVETEADWPPLRLGGSRGVSNASEGTDGSTSKAAGWVTLGKSSLK